MIKVTQADVGRLVIYQSGKPWQEEGVITSFNDTFVMVRYKNEITSKGTRYEDLEYTNGSDH